MRFLKSFDRSLPSGSKNPVKTSQMRAGRCIEQLEDRTLLSATLMRDIHIGATGSDPQNLIAVGNRLFFTANDGTNGIELWSSNGTTIGTSLVKDINLGSGHSFPRQ